MTALLVDDRSWIPEGYSGPAGLGEECAGPEPAAGGFFGEGEGLLVCVERAVFAGEPPPDVLVVLDQIACFDPTVIPVRDAAGGAVFPEMSEPFAPGASEKALRAAKSRELNVRTGCVAGLREPSLLTPAEWAGLQSLGADAVCRWLHLAVRRARAAGRPVAGLVVRSGLDAGSIRALISELV